MNYLFDPPIPVSVPILGDERRFPVHRVYCLVRNHAGHAVEMGFSTPEAPSVFVQPADSDALRVAGPGETISIAYPSRTRKLYHEIELVVAIGTGGENIRLEEAHRHVFGYAAGLDMTRFDLLEDLSKSGLPWCAGKSFEHSAVVGPITPVDRVKGIGDAEIYLQVNGMDRQRSHLNRLIWDVSKTIEQLSRTWRLSRGDLIFMGTPDGVAPVVPGDLMVGGIAGLETLRVRIAME